jgi:hypothetical protein
MIPIAVKLVIASTELLKIQCNFIKEPNKFIFTKSEAFARYVHGFAGEAICNE